MKSLQTVLVLALIHVSVCFQPVKVRIANGNLQGSFLKSRLGRRIYAFRGIPYAQPPVGALRFQPPQPAASWKGVRQATHDGNMCLQQLDSAHPTITVGSEDCLYLNVYTSISAQQVQQAITKSHAVIVWFHGGCWMHGSANSSVYGPQYLLDRDVILVTMNYRLGPLGFLSMADDVIPGNYALKDHVMALQWVQKNIAAFGGDPNKVTIMGQSAGAFSVHYLMLSRLAEGLFHQAISQSGSAIASVSLNTGEAARATARQLGASLRCPTDTSETLLQCLRGKDGKEMISILGTWPPLHVSLIPFRPVVESNHSGAFLTDDPMTLLKNRQTSLVPWMTGVNSDEGSGAGQLVYGESRKLSAEAVNANFFAISPVLFGYAIDCLQPLQDFISTQIRGYYFSGKSIDDSTMMNLVNLVSDGQFKYPTATAIEHSLHVKSSIYYYTFKYSGDMIDNYLAKESKLDFGVAHSEELFYLFPMHQLLLPNSVLSETDVKMIHLMTTLWTNFAIYGKPVPKRSSEAHVMWHPVESKALENYVIRNPARLVMQRNMHMRMSNLWSNFPCRAGLSPLNRRHDS